MAEAPPDALSLEEVSARSILEIMFRDATKVGEGALVAQLNVNFLSAGGSAEDFLAGLKFACERD